MMAGQGSKTAAAPFPIETVLRDGTPVLIRPVQTEDKHLLAIGMEHLSKQSRYIRVPENEASVEVAVTVVDSHQGKGLGTLRLAALAQRATEIGVREFVAFVLSDNHRMLKVFKELGASTKFAAVGEVGIRISLFADATLLPADTRR